MSPNLPCLGDKLKDPILPIEKPPTVYGSRVLFVAIKIQ